MPRLPKFKINQSDGHWWINIPKSISPTNKRTYKRFNTLKEAKDHRAELLKGLKEHGLKPSVVQFKEVQQLEELTKLADSHELTIAETSRILKEELERRKKSMPLGKYAEVAKSAAVDLGKSSRDSIENIGKRLIKDFGEDKLIHTFTKFVIYDYLIENWSDIGGRNSTRGNLSQFFKHACFLEIIDKNPALAVPKFSKNRSKKKKDLISVLLTEEVKDWIDHANTLDVDDPMRLCSYLLVFTGAMPSEIMRGQFRDITFSQVGMPTILIKGTKNESRLRRIPIQPNLQHLILPWMDIIKSKSKEYFFPDGLMEDGEINKNKWRYHFDKISKNKNLLIGQRYLQWPKLINRHTYASMRVANGVPLNVVKEEMGHEYKSMTTLKHYIDHHLDIDDGTTFWNIGLENPSRLNNVVGH
ncbi:site-specific integrase [Verrucomicrobiales bacterium]|nr:site-specific integrase [Verrucomicrobiales bacterium]